MLIADPIYVLPLILVSNNRSDSIQIPSEGQGEGRRCSRVVRRADEGQGRARLHQDAPKFQRRQSLGMSPNCSKHDLMLPNMVALYRFEKKPREGHRIKLLAVQ